MGPTVYTVGHSNRNLDEFIALLCEHTIPHVVDVRKLSDSKRYPHFNADTLAEHLANHDLGLTRAAGLAGRRMVSKEIDFAVNAWWQIRSCRRTRRHSPNTADRGDVRRSCVVAVPPAHHRQLSPRRKLPGGTHYGPGQLMTAELSAGAVPHDDASIVYPQTDDTMK